MRRGVFLLGVIPLACATSWKSAGVGLDLALAAVPPASVFPKAPGNIDEEAIAEMMEPPRLPSGSFRVAVAAVPAFGPGSPDSLVSGVAPAQEMARAMESAGRVELATEVTPFLPTRGNGIEGLRELAARYRAPYLLVYVERFEETGGVNAFGLAYLTLVGGLLLPSYTVRLDGVVEASVLDVRTGTLLFTVREPVRAESKSLPLSAGARLRELVERESSEAAKRLAKRVTDQWMRFSALAMAGDAGQ